MSSGAKHAFNLSTLAAEAGRSLCVQGQSSLHSRTCLKNTKTVVVEQKNVHYKPLKIQPSELVTGQALPSVR